MKPWRIAAQATGLVVAACGLTSGCGSSDQATFATKISPEMQAKQTEVFKN